MSAPFVIDPATGRLRFPDLNLELSPGMTQAELMAASSRMNRDNLGANDGWHRYSLRQAISGGSQAGAVSHLSEWTPEQVQLRLVP